MEKKRKDALKKGDKHYFTGNKCRKGHLSKRWTKNGNCIECMKIHYQNFLLNDNKVKKHQKQIEEWSMNNNNKSKKTAFNHYQSWTDKDISVILKKDEREYFYSDKEASKIIGRSVRSVCTKRFNLNKKNSGVINYVKNKQRPI